MFPIPHPPGSALEYGQVLERVLSGWVLFGPDTEFHRSEHGTDLHVVVYSLRLHVACHEAVLFMHLDQWQAMGVDPQLVWKRSWK